MVLDGFTLSSTMAVGTRQSPSAVHLMKGMFDGLPLAQSFWRGAGLPNAVEPLALAVLYRQKRSNTKFGICPSEEILCLQSLRKRHLVEASDDNNENRLVHCSPSPVLLDIG